ncbi:Vms1/Ankzf1 family peptidyl-tRNA hydrolase [Halorarum halobium]|uniref:Vms1/Ankzf1 family peptidyl-tRNA hydrolase n=1 Tax=Halorarum halobium TaxID=3075121 RepID=UPI0028AF047D|nr:Vms1/Ankzf1 family peptidyl-tRNA hydrolase [Halobaculum sp. XH14]
MLDRLLGRAGLKARIEDLEDERDSLRGKLDGEAERRREAVHRRQEAEERVNDLEHRIEELEDRVDRAEGEEAGPSPRGTETLGRGRLDSVLSRLRSVEAGAEGALSAMVTDEVPDALADQLGDRAPLVRRAAPTLVYHDDAGLVSCALDPPLAPEPFCEWAEAFRVEESWFRPTGRLAFGLVRSDTFGLGVYEDGERVSFEGVTTDVMSEHDKGGYSQARFERIRDEQIDEHLDRCRELLADVDAERVVLVGERTVLTEVREHADHTAGSDATGDPEDALADAFEDFWTATLRLL